MNKFICILILALLSIEASAYTVRHHNKLHVKSTHKLKSHQDEDGEENEGPKQPGLDVLETALPLTRCDQVIGVDGQQILDNLDIGNRSPAHLQLNFNNANLFEVSGDPSSLISSIDWANIDIPLVVYTNGAKCVQFKSTTEKKEFGFCANSVAERKQMVFAIELLIECRKGINIGENEFEYREAPTPEELAIEEGDFAMDEQPEAADEIPSDPEEAELLASEQAAEEEEEIEIAQKLYELNEGQDEDDEDEEVGQIDESQITPGDETVDIEQDAAIEKAMSEDANVDANVDADQDEDEGEEEAEEQADEEAQKAKNDLREKINKILGKGKGKVQENNKEKECGDRKKMRFASKVNSLEKQALFMIKKNKMVKNKKARKAQEKAEHIHHKK